MRIDPNSRPDHVPAFVVELPEWDEVGPERDNRLRFLSLAQNSTAQRIVHTLASRIDFREGYEGLEIASTSFVGRVDVGPVRIAVIPKLPAMPLSILLRYAYGLRDIEAFHETETPTTRHGLHDLLIVMLATEIEELLHSGLTRHYVPKIERLESPRGGILLDEIARSGGLTEARLPCRPFDRRVDWPLNQVLLAGLHMAATMTEDHDLRRYALQIADSFGDVQSKGRISAGDISRVERGLTRLTRAYAPALTIVRLLHDMLGVAFERADDQSRMPGFLFDMNAFFQRLISRFLRDNLTDTVVDEWSIRHVFAFAAGANPKQRSAPTPRPDFALFRGKTLSGFVDAKYRDIWDHGLPADWLYQLSIYALASPTRTSVMLYATMSSDAREERIEVRHPLESHETRGVVVLRPLSLLRLAELVHPDKARQCTNERRQWAEELASHARSHAPAV